MARDIEGFDPNRLNDRIKFLRSRADAHLAIVSERMLHQACAATLLCDAGCIAFILGMIGEARESLRRAGHLFLGIGLTTGAVLVALADTRSARGQIADYPDVVEGVRQQWSRVEARGRDEAKRPMTEMARGSPRQMFSLMQSEWLTGQVDGHPMERDDSPVRAALERNGGYPVGETGLSIDSYRKLADWMTAHTGRASGELPDFVVAGMATIAATRAEKIRAATKDRYHWRMLVRPTELLDIDSIVLMFVALGTGTNEDALRMRELANVPLGDAPLKAALSLRSDQKLDRDRSPYRES